MRFTPKNVTFQREYSKLVTFKPVTEKTNFLVNQIADQITRGGKSADLSNAVNSLDSTTEKKPIESDLRQRTGAAPTSTAKPKAISSLSEFQKQKVQHDKDIKMLQEDLKLLSALLGRPISVAEIPSLLNQVGRSTGPSTVSPKNVVRSTASTASVTRPASQTWTPATVLDTAKYVEAAVSTSVSPPNYYGKSNEAIIAALLKEQGIGPENNNLPIDVSCTFLLQTENF